MTAKRTTLKTLGLAALLALAVGAVPAVAQDKITMKLGWVSPDNPLDPYAIGARAFKDEVEKNSKGRITIQLYPNRQLGDEKQMAEGLQFGTVDAGVITNGALAQIEPTLQILDLPFLYPDAEKVDRVVDGKIGEQIAKKVEGKGILVLGFMGGGFRHMINNVRPVNKPEDVKNVKYRVMQNPIYIDMFSSLGGNAVPMAWAEVYTAVQQGTLDGLELPISVIESLKVNEITKYLSLTHHTYSVIELLVSKRWFDKLPADLKKVVRDAGKVATLAQRKAFRENEAKQLASLKAKGWGVNVVADLKPFATAVKSVHDKYRASNPAAGKLFDEVSVALR